MFAENNNEQFIKLVGLFKELEPKYRDYIFKEIDLLLKMQEEKNGKKPGKKLEDAE